MSIIEKAVDKLSNNDQRKHTGGISDTSTPEPNVAQPSVETGSAPKPPSGEPPILTQTETATAVDASEYAPELRDADRVSDKPEIRLSELSLEGILSPEGGRTRLDEEYRMIKRPLLVRAFSKESQPGTHLNLIMITSSLTAEGKTFTSLNLAISIAMEMDKTVLLVDADLAKPNLSRILGVNDRSGFTECLKEESLNLGDFLMNTDVPKLKILPAGERHNRATELLSSNSMRSRLDELATRYSDRIILFDSPPLLATSESSVLASHMGQVAVVVEYGVTPQYLVKEAVGLIQSDESISLILNKTREDLLGRHMAGYGYGYGKGYGYGTYADT